MAQAPRLTPEQNLIHRAQVLYNAAPEDYIEFAKALGFIMEEVTVAVTEAPASTILVFQGKAQQMRWLMEKLYPQPPTQARTAPSPPTP